jgi:hypothetical protein
LSTLGPVIASVMADDPLPLALLPSPSLP